MKKLNLTFALLSFVLTIFHLTPSYSHVVPEDELRNQVYLSSNEALKMVFEGVRKIKKEKRKISRTQQKQTEDILQKKFKRQRIVHEDISKGYTVVTRDRHLVAYALDRDTELGLAGFYRLKYQCYVVQ